MVSRTARSYGCGVWPMAFTTVRRSPHLLGALPTPPWRQLLQLTKSGPIEEMVVPKILSV